MFNVVRVGYFIILQYYNELTIEGLSQFSSFFYLFFFLHLTKSFGVCPNGFSISQAFFLWGGEGAIIPIVINFWKYGVSSNEKYRLDVALEKEIRAFAH